MKDLEVRDLRYFRAVAEELNFSRAAERLGMAQPPLSRAIRQLERRLGVTLLERTTHHVALTTAGRTLFHEAERALDAMSAAARRTRRAALTTPTLIVTVKPGEVTDLLRRIVVAYAALPGTPRVDITVSGYGEQTNMLRDGRADLALLGSPYDRRGLGFEPLVSEPRVAALPSDHELAKRKALSRYDLAGLPIPRCPGATAAERDYWAGGDSNDSRPDESARQSELYASDPVVRDSSQLLEAVALGQGVVLIPISLAEHNVRDDITYRLVPDASPYLIDIVWADGTDTHWSALFVRTAVKITTSQEHGMATPNARQLA